MKNKFKVIRRLSDLANTMDWKLAKTTDAHNGLPQNIEEAIIDNSIIKLRDINTFLKKYGCNTDIIILTKKDNWEYWHRVNTRTLETNMLYRINEHELFIDLKKGDQIRNVLTQTIRTKNNNNYTETKVLLKKIDVLTKIIQSQLEGEKNTVRVYIDEDLNYKYKIGKDDAYYYSDRYHYRLGICVREYLNQRKFSFYE